MSVRMILLASLLVAAASPEGDKAKLQGGWFTTASTIDGEVFGVAPGQTASITFDGDNVLVGGIRGGTFKLDPTKTPKQIDILYQDPLSLRKDVLAIGIYKLEGDKLTMCMVDSPAKRPEDFTCERGSNRRFRVLEKNPNRDVRTPVPPPTGDLKKVQGDWFSTHEIEDGVVVRTAPNPSPDFSFRRDYFAEHGVLIGGCWIDETKEPKEIKLRYYGGPQVGKIFYGIYKLEGDKLTICKTLDPEARPKDFTSKAGSGRSLTILRRQTDF